MDEFLAQICSTRFAMNFLFIIATTERKVRFCVKLFDHFLTDYSSFWAEITLVSSQIHLGLFHKISARKYFWKFSTNLFHSMELLFPDLQYFALVSSILLSSYCAKKFWKHLQKYFHMSFVYSQGGTSK